MAGCWSQEAGGASVIWLGSRSPIYLEVFYQPKRGQGLMFQQSTFSTCGCREIQLNLVKINQAPLKAESPGLGAANMAEKIRPPSPQPERGFRRALGWRG